VYVLASDGMLHQLSVQTGKDVVMQPVRFLAPNSNASPLILIDNVLYTSTSNECGGTPNGVWAIDLGNREKPITSWKSDGPNIVGSAGPVVGTGGTVYVATDRTVAALEPRTLKLRDYFTAPSGEFVTSPLVFEHRGKDLVAVASKDGRLYILNSTSLGGTDHRTPLTTTSLASDAGALASWEDADGTRWILAATSSATAAFRLVERDGIPTFEQAWVSREMTSPLPPIVINNVVFAVSSGEYRPGGGTTMTAPQRAQRSRPAVLYALDATTGKELWNSGATITSFVHSGGLSGGLGQVYIGTYDGTLYAFGFPIEK
jgi:outer membrane protein assembly factor BamB